MSENPSTAKEIAETLDTIRTDPAFKEGLAQAAAPAKPLTVSIFEIAAARANAKKQKIKEKR